MDTKTRLGPDWCVNRPLQILLLEDSDVQAAKVQALLQATTDFPHQCTHSSTLSDAKKLMAERRFDIALADLHLPDSDGLETLEGLLRTDRRVPVVVLTSQADSLIGMRAIKVGAQDYVQKAELSQDLLVRSILYAIERHRQWLQLMQELDDIRALYASMESAQGGTAVVRAAVAEYRAVLDQASRLDENTRSNLRVLIAPLARSLADRHLGAKEVLEVHYTAIMEKVAGALPPDVRGTAESGRQMLVYILAELVEKYRKGPGGTG